MYDTDDLAALRVLRAEVPTPNSAQLAGGRWKLISAAAEEGRGGPARAGRNRWSARVTRRSVIAAVTAGVLVASGGVSGSQGPRTNPAAYVLDAAAKNAEKGSARLPGPHQWAYLETVACMPDCFTRATWWRGDGTRMATGTVDVNGHVHVVIRKLPDLKTDFKNNPVTIYESLSRLPTEPHALLTQLRTDPSFRWAVPIAAGWTMPLPGKTSRVSARVSALGEEAGMIFAILEQAPTLPPQVNAALFRALKLIPNTRLISSSEDALHRRGLGIQVTSGGPIHLRQTLILDSKTYAYLGYRMQWHGAHDFTSAFARKASGIVDQPGQIPRR